MSWVLKLIAKRGAIYAAGLLVVLVLGYIGWLKFQLASRDRELYRVGMVADSTAAAHDATHRAQLDSVTAIAYRRVIQTKQERDSLDKALKLVRQANYVLTVSLKSYAGQSTALATSTGDTLRGHFEIRESPYTISADAMLVPKPKVSTLGLKVRLDTIPLGLRVGCSTETKGLTRSATVVVNAPSWAVVGLPSLSQSPEVCQDSRAFVRPSTGRWEAIGKFSVVGALGYGLARLLGWP